MPRRAPPIVLRAVTGANPIYASPSEAVGANTRLIAQAIRSGQRILQAERRAREQQSQANVETETARNGVKDGQ